MANGRIYSFIMDAVSFNTARDLMRLTAAAAKPIEILSITVTQDTSEVSEMVPFQLQRSSTSGTGTSVTPEKFNPSDAAFGGTAIVNLTAATTISGNPLHRESVNLQNGFYWKPIPDEGIIVPGGGIFVCRMDADVSASIPFTLSCIFKELG
jgi:hypothetical protein